MRVPISPHILTHLLLSLLLIIAILVSVKWYFIVVLICIYLVTNDFTHLFLCNIGLFFSWLIGHFFLDIFDMTFQHVDFFCILFGILSASCPAVWCLSLTLENSRSLLLQIFLRFFSFFWYFSWTSQVVLVVKNLPANEGDIRVPSLGQEDQLY